MPSPKKYFPCSREIILDHEVWDLIKACGYKAFMLWLHILANLDRTGNHWELHGGWKNGLARIARMNEKSVDLAICWMVQQGWLSVSVEPSKHCKDSRKNNSSDMEDIQKNNSSDMEDVRKNNGFIIFRSLNYMKYHKIREADFENDASLLTQPNLTQPIIDSYSPACVGKESLGKPSAFDRRQENGTPISEEEIRSSRSGSREIFSEPISEVKKPPTPLTPRPPLAPVSAKRKKIYTTDPRFEKFWSAYPRKRNKGDAEKAWHEDVGINDVIFTKILSTIEQAKKSHDWIGEDGKYIPHPATWLRRKGWEDEYVAKKQYGEELSL